MTALRLLVPILLVTTGCSANTLDPGSSTSVTATSTSSASSTTRLPVTTITSPTSPTSSTSAQPPLAGHIIVVDPGHNGMNWAHSEEINRLVDIGNGTKACNTTGTATDDGYTEPEFTWAVAQLTSDLLEKAGASVVLTRPDNEGWGPCIDERADVGNRNQASAVISIHADGGPATGRGFHVIHPAPTSGLTDDIYDDSLRLARVLHSSYLTTGMPVADYIAEDGFSERDDLGGLNLSDVPAVFLEAGNMRNDQDAQLLVSPRFQSAAAGAITEAIIEFLGD